MTCLTPALTAVQSTLANMESGLTPTKDIPGYTLVDVNIGYDVGPWTARLIVSNIFDERPTRVIP